MASEENEIEYFNVKNTSVRLVHIGGIAIGPEQIKAVVDDKLGINRADVEGSEYLEETDEDVTHEGNNVADSVEVRKVVAAKKTTTKKAASGSKTATGAGWSAAKS